MILNLVSFFTNGRIFPKSPPNKISLQMEGGQSYKHRVKFYQRFLTPFFGIIDASSQTFFLSESNFTNEVSVLVQSNGNLKVLGLVAFCVYDLLAEESMQYLSMPSVILFFQYLKSDG